MFLVPVCLLALLFTVPTLAHAEWTPLISSSNFSGIQTDLTTAAAGILACIVIVLGIGLLLRALMK